MKRLFVVFLVFALFSAVFNKQQSFAQNVVDGVYVKENIPGKRPVPYPSLREADMLWTKKIWQIIDCREKMNHPFYYPLVDMDDRKSLISLLIYGINNEGLTAYKDHEFKEIYTRDEVYALFDALADTQNVPDPNTGELVETVIEGEIKYDEVYQYEMKEQWYFDKQHSIMKIRTLAICPVRRYLDVETGQVRKQRTFWVYFPEVRPLLAGQEVFNRHNDAQRISFDDIFFQRRFSSYIVRETNVHDNREVLAYLQGLNTLLEAEKIKQELFEMEHDLWEF
ncbi:MAG: gliding motility protein GldN [Bacteroidales bacterium]|nr:gliding motility protein GldN [Bacteroidales bacterium]